MSYRFPKTIAAGATACLLLLAMTAAAASADPGRSPDEIDHPAGRFYGNFDLDILLFAAGTAEDICTGEPEPTVRARVQERADGTTMLWARSDDVPFVLYRADVGAPEFIEQTCGALLDGDPATVPVQPFAAGVGRFRERSVTSPDGVVAITNSVSGLASSPDGTTWTVRTWADFDLVDGMPVGDPAEFQGLAIRQVQRRGDHAPASG